MNVCGLGIGAIGAKFEAFVAEQCRPDVLSAAQIILCTIATPFNLLLKYMPLRV